MRKLPRGYRPPGAHRATGVFTVAMAYADGVTRAQARHRLATGEWRAGVGDGILLDTDAPHPLAPLVAAMITWPDGVLIRESAAIAHGLAIDVPAHPVHVWVPVNRRPRAGMVPHRYELDPDDVVALPYGRVTSRARTIHDVHAHLPARQVDELVALSIIRGDVTSASLEEHRRARPGCWGNGQLARLSEETRDGALSHPERVVVALLRRARLRGWTLNAPVHDEHGLIGVVDVLFEERRLAIEINGYAYHAVASFERDHEKINRLALRGYTHMAFTARAVRDRPERVLEQIVAALARLGGEESA